MNRIPAFVGVPPSGGADGPANASRRRAFTLLEVSISSLLVGTILVAAMTTTGAVLRFRSSTSDQARATLLATDLLAEIQQRSYADPNQTPAFGCESGETARSQFDDVDDYDAWTESPPKNQAGAALSGFTGWSRSVAVVRAQRNAPMQTASSDEGLNRISITVSKNGVTLRTIDALKANF